MKVLIADRFPAPTLEALRKGGCDVHYDPDLSRTALVQAAREHQPEVLVVRGTEVSADALRAAPLGLVVRAGAGSDTIDVASASERGISVSTCPGKNAVAVAELTLGLALALDRRICEATADLRAGAWDKARYSRARGLLGRTYGVVGFGAVGRETARRARAFGMNVVVWSRSLDDATAEAEGVVRLASALEVAASADVVSVHLALTPQTRGFLGRAFFDSLRPSALFVNTARAELVDETAMLEAVRRRGVRVAVDVFQGEPSGGTGEVKSPLFAAEGVYGTHHVGGATEQAQEAVAQETVRVVLEYLKTGRAPNCVNLARRTAATHDLLLRFRDRVGVLAEVFAALRDAGISVQQTENVVFEGGAAAMARIQVDQEPSPHLLEAIRRRIPDVYHLRVVPLR